MDAYWKDELVNNGKMNGWILESWMNEYWGDEWMNTGIWIDKYWEDE